MDNNINFTAKLDLSNIKHNKRVWNSVGRIFEEKTRKIPYEFELNDNNGAIDIYAISQSKSREFEHGCELSKEGTENLLNRSPNRIAGKLIKLLNIFKNDDKTTNTILECLEKLEKNDKYGNLTKDTKDTISIYDRVYWAILDKAKADISDSTMNDLVFKDAKFV